MEDWITIRNLRKRNPKMGTRTIAKKLTAACTGVDLELMARGHGVQYSAKAHIGDELVTAFRWFKEASGPVLIDMVVRSVNEAVDDIPMSPLEIKK